MRPFFSAVVCASLAAGAAAGETPRSPQKEDWLFRGTLPSYLRMETRQVATGDADAARTALGGWMEDHHGVEAEADDNQPDFGDARWVIRADLLPRLDAVLAKLGRLTPGPEFAPQSLDMDAMAQADAGFGAAPVRLAMIDVRDLAVKRDGLRADLDRLSGRSSEFPNVVRLGEAYAASLDAVLAAKKRYDSEIAVDISFADRGTDPNQFSSGGGRVDPHGANQNGTVVSEHGPNTVTNVVAAAPPADGPPAAAVDPDASDRAARDVNVGGRKMVSLLAYRERPGAFRVPPGGDPPDGGDDYLAWDAVAPPSLDDDAELRAVATDGDAAAARERLDAALRRSGASPAGIPARGPLERVIHVGPQYYAALRPSGYWVARDGLERVRKILAAGSRLKAWETLRPRGASKRVRDEAAVWERGLAEELRSDDGHLASEPRLKSLVVDQLGRLQALKELDARSDKEALVSVQVMSPRPMPAPLPAAPTALPSGKPAPGTFLPKTLPSAPVANTLVPGTPLPKTFDSSETVPNALVPGTRVSAPPSKP